MPLRLILLIAVAVSLPMAVRAEDTRIDADSVFSLPSTLTRLTPTPHFVSMAIAELCVSPPPLGMLAPEIARAGPHASAAVYLYASEHAVASMASPTREFPQSTIILKEKLREGGGVAAVGGMIKRAAGFDPEHGDWEYFYAEKAGALTRGRLPNCIACHARAQAADYVYTVREAGS